MCAVGAGSTGRKSLYGLRKMLRSLQEMPGWTVMSMSCGLKEIILSIFWREIVIACFTGTH